MASIASQPFAGLIDRDELDRRRSSAQTIRRLASAAGSTASSKRSTRVYRPLQNGMLLEGEGGRRDGHKYGSSIRHFLPLVADTDLVRKERDAANARLARQQEDPKAMLGGRDACASLRSRLPPIANPSTSTSISQRFRRAIINDDLPTARNIVAHANALLQQGWKDRSDVGVGHQDSPVPEHLGPAGPRAHLRQRQILLADQTNDFRLTQLQTPSNRALPRFCVRNLSDGFLETEQVTTYDGHGSSASLNRYVQRPESFPMYPRGSIEAEADGTKSSLELAIIYGCGIELVEWLLEMGHEEAAFATKRGIWQRDRSAEEMDDVLFTRDQCGRSIPHLAAVHNRPDVVSLYCSHIHYILSFPPKLPTQTNNEKRLSEHQPGRTSGSLSPKQRLGDGEGSPFMPLHEQGFPRFERNDLKTDIELAQVEDVHTTEDAGQIVAALLDSSPVMLAETSSHRDPYTASNPFAADGRCALHDAAMRGYDAVIITLLELGADPRRLDSYGNTALHYASSFSHVTTLQILIEAPAPSTQSPAANHRAVFSDSSVILPTSPQWPSENGSGKVSAAGVLESSVSAAVLGNIFGVKNDGGFSAADYAFTFGDKATLEGLGRRWFAENRETARRKVRQAAEAAALSAERTLSPTSQASGLLSPETGSLTGDANRTALPTTPNSGRSQTPDTSGRPSRAPSASLLREHLPNLHKPGLLKSAANSVAAKRAALSASASERSLLKDRESSREAKDRESMPLPSTPPQNVSSLSLPQASAAAPPLVVSSPTSVAGTDNASSGMTSSPLRQMTSASQSDSHIASPQPISLFSPVKLKSGDTPMEQILQYTNAPTTPSLLSTKPVLSGEGAVGAERSPPAGVVTSSGGSLRRRGSAIDRIKSSAKEVMHLSRASPVATFSSPSSPGFAPDGVRPAQAESSKSPGRPEPQATGNPDALSDTT